MASYSIEVSATAERQLRKLGAADRIRVLRAIQGLALEPRPAGCRKLRSYQDVYRVRVGRFRVLYSIERKRLVVIILKVGDRGQIYR
jgi:mRNA interferase RelE/StbE